MRRGLIPGCVTVSVHQRNSPGTRRVTANPHTTSSKPKNQNHYFQRAVLQINLFTTGKSPLLPPLQKHEIESLAETVQISYAELSQKSILICQLKEFQKEMLTGDWAEIWEPHVQLLAWLYCWNAAILDLTFP